MFSDSLAAISAVAKQNIYELAPEIYALLSSEDEIIRSEAVATLGFPSRLHLPEFRDQAYKIFTEDGENDVKYTAILAWTSYYKNTNDKEVIKKLFLILSNLDNAINIRTEAYAAIFRVISDKSFGFNQYTDTTSLVRCKTKSEFEQKINWQVIESIMMKHCPEVLKK